MKAVEKFCSKLVVGVTSKTKEGINAYVKHGIKQGWSMGKVVRQIRPLVGLTGTQAQSVINFRNLLAEKHPGYSAAQLDKATMRYTDKTHRLRLENIARTETARAQNIGYCQGLGEVGVKEVELSNADDPCEICEGLNGTRYKIDEASGIIPVHPRCRCAMLPVINGKPIDKPLTAPPANLWQTVPDYTETVSNEFKSLVTKQVGAYPKKVTRALTEKNIKFRAGKRLTELHPELKGKHPRGWSRGSTWDSAEGAFHIKSNSISVAETYRPIRQKFYVKVPEKRVIGVLNHETGHAFNTVGMYSETNEFKLAYKKDVSNLTQLDIAENNLRYFLQSGSVGRDETFAESFAVLSGQGSNVWGDDITKFFPNSAKYVKDLLK